MQSRIQLIREAFQETPESFCKLLNILPLDILRIARTAQIKAVKNSAVHDLLPDEDAKTYYNGRNFIII